MRLRSLAWKAPWYSPPSVQNRWRGKGDSGAHKEWRNAETKLAPVGLETHWAGSWLVLCPVSYHLALYAKCVRHIDLLKDNSAAIAKGRKYHCGHLWVPHIMPSYPEFIVLLQSSEIIKSYGWHVVIPQYLPCCFWALIFIHNFPNQIKLVISDTCIVSLNIIRK